MIICKLHLPLKDNKGTELTEVHAELKTEIIKMFNGCTVVTGQGVWMDNGKVYDEPVAIYEIATWGAKYRISEFVKIAHKFAVMSNQLAVYYTVDNRAFIDDITVMKNNLKTYNIIARSSASRPC